MSWSNFSRGYRCPVCANQVVTHEQVEQEFKKAGFLLVSKYKAARQKLDFVCDKNHNHSISWMAFRKGERCGLCFAEKSYSSLIRDKTLRKVVKSVKKYFPESSTSNLILEMELGKVAELIDDFYQKCPRGHHVDHIVPISFFSLDNYKEIQACWNLQNLRYLEVTKNLSRGNRMSQDDIFLMRNNCPDIFYAASRNPYVLEKVKTKDNLITESIKQIELPLSKTKREPIA
jgi:5-methylcytosine-specific restriction endonuclease McrA